MTTPLPPPAICRGGAPWNVFGVSNPERMTSTAEHLEFRYVPRAFGLDSGAALRAAPAGLPADRATLAYEVFFPADFDFVKGGKLPGFMLGVDPTDGASGGKWDPSQGSFRLMFREGGKAIGYAYLAVRGGNEGAYRAQGPAYRAAVDASKGDTGHDMWYKKQGGMTLRAGRWNAVRMSLKLNAPGRADGSARVTVNGVTRSVDGVVWRQSAAVRVQSVALVSFFGGGSLEWATPKRTFARLRALAVSID